MGTDAQAGIARRAGLGRTHGVVALAWLCAATAGMHLAPSPDPTVGPDALRQPLQIDFFSYWSGYRVFRSGLNPYDTRNSASAFGFEIPCNRAPNNPPWLFFLMAPILNLPLASASLLWLGIEVALAIGTTLWIWRGLLFAARPPPSASVALAAAALAVPVVLAMHYGQTSMLLVAGATAAMIALAQGHFFWAGVWLSVCTLKPHLFLIPGLLACHEMCRNPRARWVLGGGAVGLTAITALPLAMNPAALGQWLDISARVGLLDWKTSCLQTWIRLGIRALGVGEPAWICWIFPVVAAIVTIAYLVIRRPAIAWATALPPALVLSLVCAPYHWSYDQALSLPLQTQLLGAAADRDVPVRDRRAIVISVAILFLLAYALKAALPNEMYFFWYPFALLGLWVRFRRAFPARWRCDAAGPEIR